MSLNILIIGGNGTDRLGTCRTARAGHVANPQPWVVHTTERSELDMTEPDSIREAVRRLQPDVILNATATPGIALRASSNSRIASM